MLFYFKVKRSTEEKVSLQSCKLPTDDQFLISSYQHLIFGRIPDQQVVILSPVFVRSMKMLRVTLGGGGGGFIKDQL